MNSRCPNRLIGKYRRVFSEAVQNTRRKSEIGNRDFKMVATIQKLFPEPPLEELEIIYCGECKSDILRLFIDDSDNPNWFVIQCTVCRKTYYFDKVLKRKIEPNT